MKTESAPRIALFDTHYPSTLTMLQSLVRAGASVICFQSQGYSPLRYSRYAKRVESCPPTDDYERFPAWLEQQLKAGRFDVVAPTSDEMCFHIAQSLQYVAERYRSLLPTRDAIFDVLFKDRLAQACDRHGIPTPRTRAPTSTDQALSDADYIGYPLILKPRSHICNPAERGRRIDNAEQLRQHFGAYTLSASQQGLIDTLPDIAWPLLQQYVDHNNPQLSCSGLLGADSQVLAAAATVKIDQSPVPTGVGTAFASYDDDPFIENATQAVGALLGRGLFEAEFLSEGSGPAMIIDVNARAFGQIAFDIARGNDLPALWHAALNDQAHPTAKPRQAVVCLDSLPFMLATFTRLLTAPGKRRQLASLWRLLKHNRNWRGWNWRDPLASILMCLWPVRHPTTYIRTHIGERMNVRLPF